MSASVISRAGEDPARDMNVDPATAQHKSEHEGRTYYEPRPKRSIAQRANRGAVPPERL